MIEGDVHREDVQNAERRSFVCPEEFSGQTKGCFPPGILPRLVIGASVAWAELMENRYLSDSP